MASGLCGRWGSWQGGQNNNGKRGGVGWDDARSAHACDEILCQRKGPQLKTEGRGGVCTKKCVDHLLSSSRRVVRSSLLVYHVLRVIV